MFYRKVKFTMKPKDSDLSVRPTTTQKRSFRTRNRDYRPKLIRTQNTYEVKELVIKGANAVHVKKRLNYSI